MLGIINEISKLPIFKIVHEKISNVALCVQNRSMEDNINAVTDDLFELFEYCLVCKDRKCISKGLICLVLG